MKSQPKFSRKLSVRSVGDNTTAQVEEYITNQVKSESFVDPVFAKKMEELILLIGEQL